MRGRKITPRKVVVPLKAKRLYVAARRELWATPRALVREMRELGFYSPATRFSDCVRAVERMIERVRHGDFGRLKGGA
jgi:hypothetical protein